jgi:hypothetical protein
MPGVFAKNFNDADERIPMARGMIEIVALGDAGVGRATFEPGWRWSVDEKPAVGSTEDYCAVPHVAYQATGRLHIVMSDGTEFDTNAGDVVVLPAGHDGWVVGDETVTLIDFGGLARPIS